MSVYFIKPVGMDGPIKIGSSFSPTSRLGALDNWSPFALELVAEIAGEARLERRFHALFYHLHERREWFRPAPELVRVIEAIKAGSFDISTLPDAKLVTRDFQAHRAALRKAWTPERRLIASYSARVRAVQNRTDTLCKEYASRCADAEVRARIEAYLADPHAHGEPRLKRRPR